jgi:hypothetical protein
MKTVTFELDCIHLVLDLTLDQPPMKLEEWVTRLADFQQRGLVIIREADERGDLPPWVAAEFKQRQRQQRDED